jgi:hypothetical protein
MSSVSPNEPLRIRPRYGLSFRHRKASVHLLRCAQGCVQLTLGYPPPPPPSSCSANTYINTSNRLWGCVLLSDLSDASCNYIFSWDLRPHPKHKIPSIGITHRGIDTHIHKAPQLKIMIPLSIHNARKTSKSNRPVF